MYPDLSYLLHDLFGTARDNWTSIFKMFGLMLVVAILTAAWLLFLELKRKAGQGIFKPEKVKVLKGKDATPGELISNAIFGFILGFKGAFIVANFEIFQQDPAGVLLSGKGNWLIGILLAGAFAGWRWWEKRKGKQAKPQPSIEKVYPHDRVGDITVVAAVSGIIGAKVFAIFESVENVHAFLADPVGSFLTGSGLAIYGGLIGGFFGVFWYLRKHKIPFLPFADAVAPALIIAYGVGRIGCQLAGDGDWGITAAAQPAWWFLPDWMWSFSYPHNVNNAGVVLEQCDVEQYKALFGEKMSVEARCLETCGFKYCHQLDPGVYPTPFYETVMSFIIGGALWAWRKKFQIAGILFFIYMIFNGVERFLIEQIRVNDKIDLGFVYATQAEIIAVLSILTGAAGCYILWHRHKKEKT